MNNKFKNILIGMSSALVIMPTGSVSQIRPPQRNDADNLASDWQQENIGKILGAGLTFYIKTRLF